MPDPGFLNSNSPAGSMRLTIVGGYPHDVSPSGPNCGTNTITCSTGNPVTGAVEEYLYQTPAVTLAGVPPASGWYFTWSQNARPNLMANIVTGNYFLRAFMFPYNNGSGNQNANPCFDNSPTFLEAPKVATCSGYPFSFNNFAFDNELDSLYFDWAQPLYTGFTTPVTFTGPYSYNNPIPGILSFAQDAGQLDVSTSLTGKYAMCMKVSAFKCGQKIAEVYRDITMILLDCPIVGTGNGVPNAPPSLSMINDPLPAPQLVPVMQGGRVLYYEMEVEAGELVHFEMQSTDTNYDPSFVPQSIEFIAVGGNLGTPYSSTTNCLYNPPCATINPAPGQTGYISYLNNEVEFNWQTECGHLQYNSSACGSPKSQYLFYFKMQDNFCPAPAFSLVSVRINVISKDPVPPDLSNTCINYNPMTNEMEYSYIKPTPEDTAQNFDFYVVFRGDGQNFAPYDTLYDYSQDFFLDAVPDTSNRYYFMRTYGGCDQESEPSDTLIAILPHLTPIPNLNPFIANLKWNPYRLSPDPSTIYEVWREIDGTNNWSKVGETGSLEYSDSINLCEEILNYQIRIAGSCGSFLVQDTFYDKLNADELDINYVTVSGGQTLIDFKPTNSDDIVAYVLLRWDGSSWVLADSIDVNSPIPHIISGSDPTAASESYRVLSVDSCNNYSDTSLVYTHNTMFLEGDLNPCEGTMKLSWNKYINWLGDVAEYQIRADITQNGSTTSGVLITTLDKDRTTYTHSNLISGAEYCYYVMAIDTTGLDTSLSNPMCIQGNVVRSSRLQYLARTTVRNDGSVSIWAFIDKDADVEEYMVQRAEDILGPWQTIGIVPKPTTSPYEVKYEDFSAASDEMYHYYRIRSLNECGGIDTVSNFGTNILLSVAPRENLTNELTWYAYRNYAGGVSHYEVYRKAPNAANWTMVATNIDDTVFTDNIRSLGSENAQFCYKVAAVEGTNPLGFVDENFGPMTSFSNEACLDLDPRGYFPTAFMPNSDIEANRTWKPQMLFEDATEYELHIVDRWGNEVFHTTDPDEGWDGTFRGNPSVESAYFFIVKYRSDGSKLKEERGSIVLIR